MSMEKKTQPKQLPCRPITRDMNNWMIPFESSSKQNTCMADAMGYDQKRLWSSDKAMTGNIVRVLEQAIIKKS